MSQASTHVEAGNPFASQVTKGVSCLLLSSGGELGFFLE